jgi:large subunit ribosomal protein L6
MSRIGKLALPVPDGVTLTQDGQDITVKGPKGELSLTLVDDVKAEMGEGGLQFSPTSETKRARSMWGMHRTLVANLIEGVTSGFQKELEINGVGYRAQVQGKNLQLQLGFSHDVVYEIPEGIKIECPKQTEVIISGINKQRVGQVAAEIRSYRPPEPYKGKGVKYKGEYIFRKEGKKK